MNMMLAGFFGGWEIVLILADGFCCCSVQRNCLNWPKALGQGIKEFKKATREVTDEVHNAMDDNNRVLPPQRNLPPATIVQHRTRAYRYSKLPPGQKA